MQTRYTYFGYKGNPGAIVDLAPHEIDSRLNEEDAGVLKFGVGVIKGTQPGKTVKMPTEGATTAQFEGITVNNRTTEYDREGVLSVRKNAAVGIMTWGRIFGRVATGATPAYDDAAYLIVSGTEAGCFTNTSGSNTIEINARFLASVENGVAEIELFKV